MALSGTMKPSSIMKILWVCMNRTMVKVTAKRSCLKRKTVQLKGRHKDLGLPLTNEVPTSTDTGSTFRVVIWVTIISKRKNGHRNETSKSPSWVTARRGVIASHQRDNSSPTNMYVRDQNQFQHDQWINQVESLEWNQHLSRQDLTCKGFKFWNVPERDGQF